VWSVDVVDEISPSNPHVLYAVRLIIQRQAIDNIWQSHRWVIHDLVPMEVSAGTGLPPSNNVHFRRLRQGAGDGTHAALFTAEASLDLHRAEAEAYAENLASSEPAIYAVLRQNEPDDLNDDPEIDVHLAEISLSPYNIQDIEDCGEDQVEKLVLHGPIAQFVRDFVETHFKPEPFKKRKRDRARIERAENPAGPRVRQANVFEAPLVRNRDTDYH
jgi:hypothetical protein